MKQHRRPAGSRLWTTVCVVGLVCACSTAVRETQPAPTPTQQSTPSPTTNPTASAPPTGGPIVLSSIPALSSPLPVGEFPTQPDGVPWPTERWAESGWPAGVDKSRVDAATELALSDGAQDRVRAVVIVHRGAIVYERYSPKSADGPSVVMPSYSVAKSVTSAFIGILVRDGRLEIGEPAPVPEWHEDPADPRAQITIEHMLHMATGVPWTDGLIGSDLARMITRGDMAAYAAAQQAASGPGEVFDYNTGTSMLLARIFGEAVGENPQGVRGFMDEELFVPLGWSPVETRFDDAGTWMGGFSADSTARGFAKFGLLYARGGEWDGRRILDEEWVEYTQTASPAHPEYGAHWWLDPRRPGVLYALGLNGQVITVDPAHDLVIVQLSTVGGDLPLQQTEAILDAFSAGD